MYKLNVFKELTGKVIYNVINQDNLEIQSSWETYQNALETTNRLNKGPKVYDAKKDILASIASVKSRIKDCLNDIATIGGYSRMPELANLQLDLVALMDCLVIHEENKAA